MFCPTSMRTRQIAQQGARPPRRSSWRPPRLERPDNRTPDRGHVERLADVDERAARQDVVHDIGIDFGRNDDHR